MDSKALIFIALVASSGYIGDLLASMFNKQRYTDVYAIKTIGQLLNLLFHGMMYTTILVVFSYVYILNPDIFEINYDELQYGDVINITSYLLILIEVIKSWIRFIQGCRYFKIKESI